MRVPTTLGSFGVALALGLFTSSALLAQCGPTATQSASTVNNVPTSDCVTRTNAQRALNHLPALRVDSRVALAAAKHSAYQASINTMTHTGVSGSTAQTRMLATGYSSAWWGENVAAGQSDCASVVSAWMGSLHHRENILSSHFTVIGMGAVRGANGVIFWTMDLASPL